MSVFREKSSQNFNAATILQQNEFRLYNSSIHCAYYACVQELLHIIFLKFNITKEQFEQGRRSSKDGTHGWAFKLIELEIAKKDRQNFKWLQKTFPELKKMREDADYSDKMLGVGESAKAFELSQSIVRLLKTSFK